jgi:hypothetical protein
MFRVLWMIAVCSVDVPFVKRKLEHSKNMRRAEVNCRSAFTIGVAEQNQRGSGGRTIHRDGLNRPISAITLEPDRQIDPGQQVPRLIDFGQPGLRPLVFGRDPRRSKQAIPDSGECAEVLVEMLFLDGIMDSMKPVVAKKHPQRPEIDAGRRMNEGCLELEDDQHRWDNRAGIGHDQACWQQQEYRLENRLADMVI